VGALRALKWTTATNFTLTGVASNIWQGYYQNAGATAEGAYNSAVAAIAEGWTDQGANPVVDDSEAHFSSVYLTDFFGGYKCELVVYREFYEYSITNIYPGIPHSVDVLVNVHDIPDTDVGYNQSFWSDIAGGSTQGLTFVYTNIPSSTNSGHTIRLRVANTNPPTASDYPTYGETIAAQSNIVRGFQAPKIQAIIKWETGF
jgi:hypothetical protein